MDQERIDAEMHELEEILDYQFTDISHLANAMRAVLLEKQGGKHNREYSNDALACLGDAVIKLLITQNLFKQNKRKGDITEEKSKLETNEVFHKIAKAEHITDYAYNDKCFAKDDPPQHEKVRCEGHDPYIEAIAAAIYLDGNPEQVSEWFENWLLPKMKQNKASQSM
jgi:dsRNA-specific ribonuclease